MSSAIPKAHEPSMEEILASIRRIISDDQDGFSSARPAVDLYAVEAEKDEEFNEDEPSDPSAETAIAGPSDDQGIADATVPAVPDFEAEPEASPDRSKRPEADSPAVSRPEDNLAEADLPKAYLPEADRPLLSEAVSASIAGTFGRLETLGGAGGAPSFEETVKDMMRPMLKAWLDQNLPGIVERLVQAEIERVTRP
jgi:cell pole-organizing protein PopZ